MCRIAAYIGPDIALERIVVLPEHSLLEQSRNATEAKLSVNGDGFGVAWYGRDGMPGLYRDVLPAWSDGNLADICRMVTSGLFLAHVRASTVGEVSRSNCHPFRYGHLTFMHNGQIGDFARVQRALEACLPDALYAARRGTTDSELFFLLLMHHGLADDPLGAVRAALAHIAAEQGTLEQPNRITCAFSDGRRICAFRTSSDGKAPSLYVGRDLDGGGCVLASERLCATADRWQPVEEGEFVEISHSGVARRVMLDDGLRAVG